MKRNIAYMSVAVCLAVNGALVAFNISFAQDKPAPAKEELKPASSFQSIADEKQRSVALFEEAGKVIEHPRCVNCHPASDRPLQDISMHPHQPPVLRGEGGMGKPGMQCNTCHGAENVNIIAQSETIKSIPGNPNWHLAPIEMAWEGKSLGYICNQIKDPQRNGGKSLDEIVEHMAHDDLVGWGWHPGEGREPVPGTQEAFGELIKAWVATGAACPS
ncbi:Isoquinoline 1-oxidoreductase subunit [Phyllobacterium endophyticum]|uniref:Isoquinoline 1-oxidoreductase subunit n=1 Tax=Phyllobacterium endophyticum TaxID=1149773 RepID=UPI0011C9611F|nr:Isoquinoline 1-oxidoreductase subunit [Phyllobacterium endophyticum]TXR46884.1 Isoquinoline 1-oxidoreductase subunit [Phyllobacterium endophyticum]